MPARRTTAVAIALLAAAALASAQEPDAAKIYTKTCALCHGPEGQPNEMFAKMGVRSFKDPEWQKVSAASEANGRLLTKAPESVFLTAADYSPLK